MRRMLFLLVLATAWLSALPVLAGQLIVAVTDRDGRTLPGVRLRIEAVGPSGQNGHTPWIQGSPFATSDGNGNARFSGLVPGSYEVRATPPDGYVKPDLNPFASVPRVTFTRDHERLKVTLALWRGGPLSLEMQVTAGPGRSSGKVHLRGLDGDTSREILLEDGRAAELMLLPGRYEVELTPPPGLLLTDLSTSEQRLSKGKVLVEIEEGWRSRNVHWKVGASARIEGTLQYENEGQGAHPEARLIEPGPWAEQLAETGGWDLRRVRGRLTSRSYDRYVIYLPEGQWRVSIAEDGLVSDPEYVDLTLASGAVGQADFFVRGEESRCSLGVSVSAPRGGGRRRIKDVQVGVWRGEDDPSEALPLLVERSRRGARVSFRDIEPGSYRVVVRHEEFLDGEGRVTVVCAGEKRGARVDVSLELGARVRFDALDEDGRPVRGALLVAEALEAPRRALFKESDREHFAREGSSDDSGRGQVTGLLGGHYRLRPRMTGRRVRELFVRIREGNSRVLETKEVHVSRARDEQVSLLVLPAASIEATLICDDGGTLPDSVDLRAFDMLALPAGEDLEAIDPEDAELRLEALTLGGVAREDVTIGPLEEGSYLLAMRPYGFERWTWLGSDRGPGYAHRLTTRVGAAAPAGVVELPCAPKAEIRVQLTGAERIDEALDPHLATVHAELIMEPSGETHVLDAEVRGGLVVIGGIPQAEGEISVVLEHPHLLPDGIVQETVSGSFERGRIAKGHFPEMVLGGAIKVFATSSAVHISGGGTERTVSIRAEGVVIGALEPGSYLLSACIDLECSNVTGPPLAVDVRPGLTAVAELARDY